MQVNIKKYLHNVPSKDQYPIVTNKLYAGKKKDACVADEMTVSTHAIKDKMIETHTNSQSNGRMYKLLSVIILKLKM